MPSAPRDGLAVSSHHHFGAIMRINRQRLRLHVYATVLAIGLAAAAIRVSAAGEGRSEQLSRINHFVVIYQENHSFDNLFGQWEGVEGLDKAEPGRTTQMNQAGNPFACLKQ